MDYNDYNCDTDLGWFLHVFTVLLIENCDEMFSFLFPFNIQVPYGFLVCFASWSRVLVAQVTQNEGTWLDNPRPDVAPIPAIC